MSEVLGTIEQLLRAARHPDIVKVERYGPDAGPWGPSVDSPGMKTRGITGVKVTHQTTSTASLWEAVWPGETPIDMPAVMPSPKRRAARLAILVAQLLDVARPANVRAWRLVTLPDIGNPTDEFGVLPYGLSLAMADGSRVLLRASATGVRQGEEPDEDPFPDWRIPADLAI